MFPAYPSSLVLRQLIHQIFILRRINRLDQHLLMSTLLNQPELAEDDHHLIDQLFTAINQGKLRIVD